MTIPFTNTGIARYPPDGPMIGQERVRKKLEQFLSDTGDPGQDNLFIYGEWGSGKSRIGYQIVSEATGTAKGWLCEQDTGYTNQPLFDDLDQTVLPIRIVLSDFVDEIDENTAAYHAFNEAVDQIIDGSTESASHLQGQLSDYGVSEIDLQSARTGAAGPQDKFESYIDILYRDGNVDRVAIIVDEVEQVDSATDISPDEVDSSGVSRRRLRTFFEGLKRAVNHIDDDNAFDFVLLTTKNLERTVNSIGGFERRKDEVDIRDPTVEQALTLTNELATEYDFEAPDDMVKALFFASGNNFGWFSNAMHSMIVEQQQASDGASYADIIAENPITFNQIFEEDYLSLLLEWDEYDQETRDAISEVVHQLRPVRREDLEADPATVLDVQTPDGISPVGPMRAVDTSRSDIVSRLESNGFEVETDPEVKLTYGGDEIIENDLKDVLEIFHLDDGRIGIYEREDDIENLTEFLIKGTAAPDTAENVVAIFKELLEDTEETTTHLAPTIQFLTRWNKAWRKQKGVSRWLPEEQWEELNEEIEEIHGPADQEVVEGFAYTRFGHDVDTLSEYSLSVPNVTVDIAGDRLVDTVESEHAVILHQPTTVDDMSDLKSDLTTLRDANKRPIAYVLFATEQERREKREELREALPSYDPFIIDHVVDDTDLTRTFLKRFSFVGEVFDFDEHVRGGYAGRGRFERKQQTLREQDQQWRETIETEGWLQRPLVPSRVQEGTKRYAAGLLHFMRGNDIATGQVPGMDTEAVASAWHAAWDDADNLLTLVDRDGREFQLPSQLPRLLDVIQHEDGTTPDELAGTILYDKEGTVSINRATKQTLDVLHRVGVVIEEDDTFYVADGDELKSLGDRAMERVEALRGADDERIEAYNERMQQLVSKFQVTGDMIDNKVGDLNDELDEIPSTDFDALRDPELEDHTTWCEIALIAHRIQKEALHVHDPGVEFDPRDAPAYPDKFSADTNYSEYPISVRLDFLDWLDDHLEEETSSLLDEIGDKETELTTTYNECRSKPFPTAEIESVLNDIRADLDFGVDVDLPATLTAETDKTLQGHLNVVEVEEVFDRLDWYDRILSRGFDENNPWNEFTTAYATMESILDQWDTYSSTIASARTYVDGSDSYEDELEHSGVDISSPSAESDTRTIDGEWPKIEQAVDNPKYLEDENQSVTSLKEDIEELERMVEAFSTHTEQVQESAREELEEMKGDLRIDTLRTLASAIGESPDVDVPDIDSYNRYVDCKNALQETSTAIEDRGEALLREEIDGGANCWPLYKRIYDLDHGEITSNDLDSTEQSQLEQLQSQGILSYEETTVYNVSLN